MHTGTYTFEHLSILYKIEFAASCEISIELNKLGELFIQSSIILKIFSYLFSQAAIILQTMLPYPTENTVRRERSSI